jgi:Ca2+-binding EF-hand superfamily protein
MWALYDEDNSGSLDMHETKRFINDIVQSVNRNFDESDFIRTFRRIDENGNGLINKFEMVYFIASILDN